MREQHRETHQRFYSQICGYLVSGFVLLAFLTAPTPSYAIPSAGIYEFTGDLTGSFGSSGTGLFGWGIGPGSFFFCSGCLDQHVGSNDFNGFSASYTNSLGVAGSWRDFQIGIDWNASSFTLVIEDFRDFSSLEIIHTGGDFGVRPLPEPTSLIMLSIGLLALAGYRWRQHCLAGM